MRVSISRADTICVLTEDDEALLARVRLFAMAEREINVACYAIGGDETALALLALLRDAAERGVCARLLVDGIHDHIPRPVREHLRRRGVEIREYHPLYVRRPDWINFRLHDKLITVDGEHAIIGSRNLEGHHFGRGACEHFLDRDVYVRGHSAACASDYFHCRWSSQDVREAPSGRLLAAKTYRPPRVDDRCKEIAWKSVSPDQAGRLLDAARDALLAELPMDELDGAMAEATLETPPTFFLHDPTDAPCWRTPGMECDMTALIQQAQCEIFIASPYVILSRRTCDALRAARRRGVRVRIFTNSLATTDVPLAHAEYENDKRGMLRMGIELWEYAGYEQFHEKTYVIDGRRTVIGSYNLDVRSETHNAETALLIEDESIAALVLASLEERMLRALPIGPDGRAIGFGVRYPGAPPSRVRAIRLQRLLTPWIRPWL